MLSPLSHTSQGRGFVVLTRVKQALLSEILKASKKFFFKGIKIYIYTSIKRNKVVKCTSAKSGVGGDHHPGR